MSDLVRSGDKQQYEAEPHQGDIDTGVQPKVTLLWMTPDPLGALAALNAIYKGRVVRNLSDVTDEERYEALADMQKTHLTAPLEAIKFHFLIEGVDRAFTHQQVRQRTAAYAQESMRFAVLGDLIDATTLPPSLAGTKRLDPMEGDPARLPPNTKEQRWRDDWDRVLIMINETYHRLVNDGMPAEEARGLLPHCTATRIHYITDLRNLQAEAGKRLCTQAQFHWRLVFAQAAQQIRNHWTALPLSIGANDKWQYEAIAASSFFRPVCYQLGHCPYDASFDRACSIRKRVQMFASRNVPSSEWHKEDNLGEYPINPAEWLADPGAARI